MELLFEIISYIRETKGKGIDIYIQSHCAAFQDIEIVEKLSSYNVSRALVPLYGSTSDIHHMVMTPKSEIQVLGFPQFEAIENCMKSNIGVSVHTVITQDNKNDLINIINKLVSVCAKHDKAVTYRIAPVYYTKGNQRSYLPFKELSPFLKGIQQHLKDIGENKKYLSCHFGGFPFCLFSEWEKNMTNSDFTTRLTEQYTKFVGSQLPSSEKLYSKVDPRIPIYRLRIHDPICSECIHQERCAGFQLLDYETFGIDGIKPVQSNKNR